MSTMPVLSILKMKYFAAPLVLFGSVAAQQILTEQPAATPANFDAAIIILEIANLTEQMREETTRVARHLDDSSVSDDEESLDTVDDDIVSVESPESMASVESEETSAEGEAPTASGALGGDVLGDDNAD